MGFLWGNGFQAADMSLNRAKNLQLGALMDDGLALNHALISLNYFCLQRK